MLFSPVELVWHTARVGRHSAAEDEDHDEDLLDLLSPDGPTEQAVAVPAAAVRSRGRHALAEDDVDDGPEPFALSGGISEGRRGGGTRADLRLMRRNRALLARCIAALILPFVLYSLVLEFLGKRGDYLLLIWLPGIVAGVLLGSLLDAAHQRVPAEPRR